MNCPSCNAQIDSGKFCPVCGKPVEAPPAEAAPASSDSPTDVSLVGKTLSNKYKVVKLLGEGGMGAVYLGEQPLGGGVRKVAIKTLHSHLSNDKKISERFRREIGTVMGLEHPNTIQVYDEGKTDEGVLYYVMEFIQGASLADIIEKQGALEPARTEKILSQICGSLAEAHSHGIVHRDLKPDNVVLSDRAGQKDFVKVLDFGIAKRSNEEDKNEQKLTQQGMVLGTPPYMSPEQFMGKPIDARSDIYSLAIMVYEMLTANLPFQANTAWEWATQHMTVPPRDIDTMPFHERISPRMKDALRKALAKSPDDRFATVGDFFDAFSGATPMAQHAGTAPAMPAAPAGKGKTEIGTPLDFSGAAAPSLGSYGSNPGPMTPPAAQAGTPAMGNVTFPTPNAGVPQPPPNARAHAQGGGGNKGMLLGIAGVVGVLSIGLVVFALKGHSSSPSPGELNLGALDAGSSAAVVDLTPDAAAEPALAISDASVPGLAQLDPNGTTPYTPPHGGGTHREGHDAGAGKLPSPTPAPSHGPAPAPGTEPIECVKARIMRAAGNIGQFQSLEKQCVAKGGHV
jgi:tRNA A-37 threonylcarbamoyl transferase component Bud32